MVPSSSWAVVVLAGVAPWWRRRTCWHQRDHSSSSLLLQRTILFRIKHQNFVGSVSNSSRLIGRPALSPEEEWARPFGMGRTDKPLLAVSIASKLLLQHDDSAIPCTMGAPPTILGIIQFGRLSLSCQQIPSSSDNPPGRNYSYLKTQQVVAVTIFSFFLYEMVYFKVPGEYSTKFLSHSVYDRPEEGDAPSP